jgi:quinoprotein glucose dehydrogenase
MEFTRMIAAIRLVHLAAAVQCFFGECTITPRWIGRAATDRNGWKIYNARLMAFLLGCFAVGHFSAPAPAWDHWGGDLGGTRFSPLEQITPANVDRLVRGWEFHTGDLAGRDSRLMARTKFEATPLFVESSLILCTPFNEVIALDPGSGAAKWRFDPKVSTTQRPANRYNCRGVAY